MVNGMASVDTGCKQCHGSKVALEGDRRQPDHASTISSPDAERQADQQGRRCARSRQAANGRPLLHASSWPNTGIGRLNLDGSLGSCSACHSRHDFSPRRARQPENCGKCHLGPDHPQKEIYEESKHGVAFRDLQRPHEPRRQRTGCWARTTRRPRPAPPATCRPTRATAARSRTIRASASPGPIARRSAWSWTPTSTAKSSRRPIRPNAETLIDEHLAGEADRDEERLPHCHTENYVDAFYKQYDDFVDHLQREVRQAGQKIMAALRRAEAAHAQAEFDEEIEWTWFYLWHHEGRRARHGASMMAPDYAHWHGMFEVAERFYKELIPQARELAHQADEDGTDKPRPMPSAR